MIQLYLIHEIYLYSNALQARSMSTHFSFQWSSTRELSHVPKNIWQSIHPRNLGNHVTVRQSVRTTKKPMCNVKLSTQCGNPQPVFHLIIDIHNIQIQPGLKAKLLLINLLFKSNNKLVIHKPVNFRADPYDF